MPRERPTPTDPIFQSSLRELRWILVVWFVSFSWVIGYCSLFGYQSAERPLETVVGMPSWVFWGVFVPWIVVASISSWFALTQMTDHPLEDETSAGDSGSQERSDG